MGEITDDSRDDGSARLINSSDEGEEVNGSFERAREKAYTSQKEIADRC